MSDYLRYYLPNLMVVAGIVGFLLGGQWVWLGFVGAIAIMIAGELLFGYEQTVRTIKHPRLIRVPLYLHVPLMFGLFAAFAWRASQGFEESGTASLVSAYAGAVLSASFLGAFANLPIIHEEFMHTRQPRLKVLSLIMGTFWGNPLAWLPHVFVHHLHAGTAKDLDTPYRGQSLYHFTWRWGIGTFQEGYRLEKERMAQSGRGAWSWRSQVPWTIILLAGLVAAFYLVAGWVGAGLVTACLLLGNFLIVPAFSYLQHYGTIRVPGESYRPHHIIEHRTFFARAATVEIVTHTNHHVNPYVPFYELKPSDIDNKMPSAILCFLISLVPPLWTWYARPYLRNIDLAHASPEERSLAREANRKAGWPDWFTEQVAPERGFSGA